MNGPVAVLDASAVLALIFAERGATVVERVMERADTVLPAVQLAEVLTVATRKRHGRDSEGLVDDLKALGTHVAELAEADALAIAEILARAAQIRAAEGGGGQLSLADAACLAVARRVGLPVLTADGDWNRLAPDADVIAFR